MGKIKTGLGPLIGNAGEYYVMAELLKRGIIAGLMPRNAMAFDILAKKGEKTASIRVKTKSEKIDVWQYSINKEGNIFKSLQDEGDFTVLVHLADDVKNVRYFILPTTMVDQMVRIDHEEWMKLPPIRVPEKSLTNPKRMLNYWKNAKKLDGYESNWDVLWK